MRTCVQSHIVNQSFGINAWFCALIFQNRSPSGSAVDVSAAELHFMHPVSPQKYMQYVQLENMIYNLDMTGISIFIVGTGQTFSLSLSGNISS